MIASNENIRFVCEETWNYAIAASVFSFLLCAILGSRDLFIPCAMFGVASGVLAGIAIGAMLVERKFRSH